jgi:DNA polymerase|tara:strand:+ start:7140 stop:8303 length:1164 start_codon:yes stop_codon:yes gene_type:complete
MEGFFDKEEVEDKSSNCMKCKLFKTCLSPKMKVTGKGKKEILVVAEAPGKTEDERGEQLIGEAGRVLREVLEGLGIDLDRDCWKTNAVCCRPPNNKTPSKLQIKCCNPRLEKVLKKKKPKLIILLGGVAVESFIGNRLSEAAGGINKWRGFVVPDQRYKAWMVSTFHPSYLLRNRGEVIIENLFRRDIKKGLKMLKKKVPRHGYYKIDIVETKRAYHLLRGIKEGELLAFDYETTGLKPYKKGHEIVCCGISLGENKTFVFDLRGVWKEWKEVLKNKKIKKTAQNIKFEHQWSRNILGVKTRGWVWDTMQASHILDNRRGITGLKFQSYINFGQEDYSRHLDKYLKCDDGKGFNNIKEANVDEVMKYCGMDAILEYKLAKKQMEELR